MLLVEAVAGRVAVVVVVVAVVVVMTVPVIQL